MAPKRGRKNEADQVIAYIQQCVVAPLDAHLAVAAAELHRQHKLAPADAVVYATSLEYGAGLLTFDSHFAGLPGVVLMRKAH